MINILKLILISLLLILFELSLQTQLFAQEQIKPEDLFKMSFEELMNVEVITASKKIEDISAAPSNITIITTRQIKEWGSRDIKDVLRRVAGYQVIADRDEWVFAVRGNVSDNNQKYLILIDGHRMNSIENFGPGQIIELPNDLSNVKRLEIIRGPGSAVWGADAMAGVINIITKKAKDLGTKKYHVSATVGQDGTYKTNFQFGEVLNDNVDFILMGSFAVQDGKKITQSAATTFPILDTESGYDNHPYGTYTTSLEKHKPGYMLQFKGQAGKFSINAFAFNTSVYNRHFEVGKGRENFYTTDKLFLEGIWKNSFKNNMDLTWKISADYNRSEFFPKKGTTFYLLWIDRRFNTSIDFVKPLGSMFSIAAGADYSFTKLGPNPRINNLNSQAPAEEKPGFFIDKYLEDKSIGGYGIFNIHPVDDIRIALGGRIDYNTDRGTDDVVINPRVAGIWKVANATTFKLLYNRGFLRPANFQSVGADVQSETMNQLDFIWLQKIGQLNLTTTLYWQKLDGFISILTLANASNFANSGDYESKGIEIEASLPIAEKHTTWANLSYCKAEGKNFPAGLAFNARRVTPNGDLLNYPKLTFNLGGTIRFFKNKVFISPAVRYLGKTDYRKSPAINSLDDAEYGTIGPFTYIDINIGFEPNSNYGFYLYVNNLTDVTEPTHLSIWNGTIEQYGRYVEAKIRVQW